jgi:alkanesulfonate monooxygenase SsuD/methylene tetrahydromethanopterin reductase-like flavin-dependent oxidoreductase (luciferase family)
VGVFVPQGWKLEYEGWSGPDAWARSVELARLAEALGYDHLWVYDHVETVPRRRPTHVFEAFTMLAALSQQTSTVGLGQLVTCASYRNAGLLAKEAACVDVYSAGRLILGLGAGWFHEEYASYGYEYLGDRQRLAVLDETIEVVRRLWTEETVTFDGDHLHFAGAYCDPKPVQTLPPVLVGGGGERVTLRIAARRADLTNWQVGLDAFERKSRLLEEHCEEVGRPFDDITRTHGPDCRIFDTDADARAWCGSDGGGDLWGHADTDEYLADNLVGTVDQVAEKAQGFVDAGCRGFLLWLRDYPGDETLRRFMAEVVPLLDVPARPDRAVHVPARPGAVGAGPPS